MRGFAAACLVGSVAVISGVPCRAAVSPAGEAAPLRENLIAVWRDSIMTWKDLSREEVSERNSRFMAGVRFEELLAACRAVDATSADSRMMEGLLKQGLDDLDLSATELATILRDPGVDTPCHKGILMYLSHAKSTFVGARGDTLAPALLELADRGNYEPGVRAQFEMAAAFLSTSDAIYERIRDFSESQSPEVRASAFDMMIESRDPRTAALLKKTLERYVTERRIPPGRVLTGAGRRLGSDGVVPLVAFLALSDDFNNVRRLVLEGLAGTQDPQGYSYLIDEYGDRETGVRDSTSSIENPVVKNRYFGLWHIGRVYEPALARSLESGPPDECHQAIEILDRGSRFGKCANKDVVIPALGRAALRTDLTETDRARCDATRVRLEDWAARP